MVCPVCAAIIQSARMEDHFDWHRTLSNRAKESK
jgi:hypothetical protein